MCYFFKIAYKSYSLLLFKYIPNEYPFFYSLKKNCEIKFYQRNL